MHMMKQSCLLQLILSSPSQNQNITQTLEAAADRTSFPGKPSHELMRSREVSIHGWSVTHLTHGL